MDVNFKGSSFKLLVIALICVLIGVVVTPGVWVTAKPEAQEFSATLTPIAGLVQYQAAGTSTWQVVRGVQLVNIGDQIRTGSDGLARLNVVTGVSVEIFPTTQVQLNNLTLTADSSQIFSLFQLVGTTFSSVTQTVRETDRIQIVLPPAGVLVRGTEFFTFVSPNFNSAVLTQLDEVEVRGTENELFIVRPDNFVYILVDLPVPPPQTCSLEFLDDNTEYRYIISPLTADPSRIEAVRAYLKDEITSTVNPDERIYVRQLIGLPSVDLGTLDSQGDQEELENIFRGIEALQANNVNLIAFLNSQRGFLNSFKNTLTNPLAPATCGNGSRDEGETAQSCPTDFTDPSPCGNGLCEIDRRGLGESLINCPADCLPYPDLAVSCAAVVTGRLGLPRSVPPQRRTPDATTTLPPPPPPPGPSETPVPSGVGNEEPTEEPEPAGVG